MTRNFIAGLALALASIACLSQQVPFIPQVTASVAVTGTAQTLPVPPITNPGPLWQYLVTNTASPSTGCTRPSFFTIDGTTTATVVNGVPILPNAAFLISVPKSVTSTSVISGATGCTFYISVGVVPQ